jgi:hypothetical protein
MRMIETLIAGQLEGEVRFEWGPQGLSCEIEIAV